MTLPDASSKLVEAFDESVPSWPDVRAKQVFGHRGYVRGRAMFAFIADEGVAVKALSDEERSRLLALEGAALFRYNDMPMKGWVVLRVADDDGLASAIQDARLAYEGVG